MRLREGCAGRDRRERCATEWSTEAKRTPQPARPDAEPRAEQRGAPGFLKLKRPVLQACGNCYFSALKKNYTPYDLRRKNQHRFEGRHDGP